MNRHAYAFAALFAVAAPSTYAAVPVMGDPLGPNGSDDFSNSAASAGKWTDSGGLGAGQLSIIDQHLSYTTNSLTMNSPDFAAWRWESNRTPDHTNWTFQIDVSVPQLSLTGSQYVLYGLQMSTAVGTFFFYDYETPGGSQFVAQRSPTDFVTATAAPGIAALRFRYDGATGDVLADYDSNGPTGGYEWTNVTSLAGLGNGTISVFGQSFSTTVSAADNVFGDNIRAVPEPATCALMLAGLGLIGYAARRGQIRTVLCA